MSVEVVLPTVLRELADGRDSLAVDVGEGADVDTVLDRLDAAYPVLGRRLRDEAGGIRRHVNVFVDGDEVRTRGGGSVSVPDGSVVLVLPSVAGG